MNNKRRKELKEIIELIDEARLRLEIVTDEEEEAYYNLPESLQESERGERMSEAIDLMRDTIDNLKTYNLEELTM